METQNSTGEVEVTYEEAFTSWVSIEPIAGREFFTSQQVQADVTTRIRMRFRAGVTETMRFIHVIDHGSPDVADVYDIEAVLPDSKSGRRELVLMCRKRGADGNRSGT